jgi:hypothetical protein
MESSVFYPQSPQRKLRAKDLKQKLFLTQQKLREEAAQSHTPTISLKRFREAVDKIEDDSLRAKVQLYYLTAARMSEASTKVSEWELLHGASRNYGLWMKYEFSNFEYLPQDYSSRQVSEVEKAFVITMATAKRGKRLTKTKKEAALGDSSWVTDEDVCKVLLKYNQIDLLKKWRRNEIQIDPLVIAILNGNIRLKTVALPVRTEYEPWTYDILKHIKRNKGKIAFNMTRQHLRVLLRKALKGIIPLPNRHSCKNILRHWRLSHLTEYYNFDPLQLSTYSGWSVQRSFAKTGMALGSSNVNRYVKTRWHSYFRKLLRPIDRLI